MGKLDERAAALGVSPAAALDLLAHHEAGHAAAAAAYALVVDWISIRDLDDPASPYGGTTRFRHSADAPPEALAVAFAAGERAALRRLRERGLWTPARAAACAEAAAADAVLVDGLAWRPDHPITPAGLAVGTDVVLSLHWEALSGLAAALARERFLDSRAARRLLRSVYHRAAAPLAGC